VAVVVSVVGALGCGRFHEIGACRALSREVNPALDRIEALSKKPGFDAQAAMAKEYSELAKRLKPHTMGSGTLPAAVRDYASVLEATSTTLRTHVDATRTGVSARVNEPRRELERLLKRERAAVTRIDIECHS
jgi:hypothetical protein